MSPRHSLRAAILPALVVLALAALTWPARAGAPALGPGIVRVVVGPAGGGPPEVAVGFEAAPGRIVTVAHVLDGDGAVSVRGAGATHPADVLRVSRRDDLALLRVEGDAHPVPPTVGGGTAVLLAHDDRAVVRAATVRRRIVAHLRRPGGESAGARRALELTATVARGDSGAPVVDPAGRVLGVVFARSRERPATAYAVAASAVDKLLAR